MKQQTVHVYVFDTLSDWEPGYAVAGINNPQFHVHPGQYRVQTVAIKPTPIVTMGGIRIAPDLTLDEVSPADSAMLILPGGVTWDQGGNTEAVDAAASFLKAGVPVAAICGATAGLARGGLLDARRHTSSIKAYLEATHYRGAHLYEDSLAVTDGDLITASGLAPLEFAQHIFRRLGLYRPAVLDAWYSLFKTGDLKYYNSLLQTAQ
jgi:putative intracellular protease/amidase